MNIDINELFEIEKKLIKQKVSFHNRADRFATAIYPKLYKRKCIDSLGDPQYLALQVYYREKFPQGALGWKPKITGFVASLDRVKKFEFYAFDGFPVIDPEELLKFKDISEFEAFYFRDDEIYEEIILSVDHFIYFGLISLQGKKASGLEGTLWSEARNHLELVTYGLINNFENNTIFQNIHLLAELTIKAVWLHNGIEEKILSDKDRAGHNLKKLIQLLPFADEKQKDSLKKYIIGFPNFAKSRYYAIDNEFLEIVDFALRARSFIMEVIKFTRYYEQKPPRFIIKRK
ncbi:hypothetical protein [Acinetobacter sp.]|jgi:hypothetical protein|uniref:hypothetical protein n=1 Tax=Acinetobacter sp. TaxID=472 RepID=UPI003C77D23A